MGIEVRRAGAADATVIALLGRITFTETFGPLFAEHGSDLQCYLDRTFSTVKIEQSLLKASNAYWLAAIDRLPVGYAKLKLGSRPPASSAGLFDQLQKIYVLQSFVGRRVGAALMQPVMSEVRARATTLWLDVLRQNMRAVTFYRRFGFAAFGEDTYRIGAQTFCFHLMRAKP